MRSRTRDEQEARNTAEVMAWVEHLAIHPDMSINLNLVCHINRLTLRDIGQNHWAGRVRAEVDWQQPEGIASEDLAHVFERFWRADPARARSGTEGEERYTGGTGLGLAVAQSLVRAQGGRIWVESTPREGTVFRFTLPQSFKTAW